MEFCHNLSNLTGKGLAVLNMSFSPLALVSCAKRLPKIRESFTSVSSVAGNSVYDPRTVTGPDFLVAPP